MRYCQFQLGGESGAAGASQQQQQLLQDLSRADHHLPPALRDKLEAALAGARKELAASSMAEVAWGSVNGGLRIPVSSEAVRVALIKLNEAKEAGAAGADAGEDADEDMDEAEEAAVAAVFGAYSEALQAVQQELARVEGEGSGPRAEAQRAELRLLRAFLQHGRLETTMRRTKVCGWGDGRDWGDRACVGGVNGWGVYEIITPVRVHAGPEGDGSGNDGGDGGLWLIDERVYTHPPHPHTGPDCAAGGGGRGQRRKRAGGEGAGGGAGAPV